MAYDKSTDLSSIQADVLTTSLAANANISKLNQLKTTQKSITKAINELKGNLSQAINKSQTASDQVTDVKENIVNPEYEKYKGQWFSLKECAAFS